MMMMMKIQLKPCSKESDFAWP